MSWRGVRPAVCHDRVLSGNTYTLKHFHLLVAPPFQFSTRNIMAKFRQDPPERGRQIQVCYEQIVIFDQFPLYLGNIRRWGCSCYATPIGNCMLSSIKLCNFQWPWVTPNLNFNFMPLFDVEYLRNGAPNTVHPWWTCIVDHSFTSYRWRQSPELE